MHTKVEQAAARALSGLLAASMCWLATDPVEARVGQHENRFRGDDLIVRGGWAEQASVTARRRKVLVFTPTGGSSTGVELRATVGADGYVSSAVLRVPVAPTQAPGCALQTEVENFLVFVVPGEDEDQMMALVYDDVRKPCQDPAGPPVTQLGQVLAGTRTSGRMRLTASEVSARTTGRGAAARLELTVTFRGTPVPDVAAAALPPRPLARPDGQPMGSRPTRDELVAAGAGMTRDLGACVSAGAAPGADIVSLELDWTGHVSNVTLPRLWSTSRGAGCLETALRKLQVPPFLQPTFTVRYPVTLQ